MTETTLDVDDLKSAWQQLDRRLEQQHALAVAQFLEGRMRRMQSGLRPLYWGQIVQVAFGAAFAVLGVSTWLTHWDVVHLRVAGIVLHVYGVAAVVLASRGLALMRRLDPTAAVVDIQRRLADLRRWYIRGGVVIGLPWWFLWMPVFMALTARVDVDVFVRAPRLFVYGVLIGVAGLAATLGLHLLARRPGWTRLAAWVDRSMVAESLRRAEDAVDEVRRFAAD